MKFRYAFEKLVELKNNEKSYAEWLLSNSIGKLHRAESSLQLLIQDKDEAYQHIHHAGKGKIAVSQLQQMQDYMHFLDRQIEETSRHVERAQAEVTERQTELTEKMKEEKIWQKAKEKAYEHFISIARKKEQEVLDEMAQIRRFHHT